MLDLNAKYAFGICRVSQALPDLQLTVSNLAETGNIPKYTIVHHNLIYLSSMIFYFTQFVHNFKHFGEKHLSTWHVLLHRMKQ